MIELLSTKLFIPRPRKNLVTRPRLVERLNAGLEKNLTLIAAPAGFGKTTLLSEWIPHSPRCVTWFSLDAADNDSIRFWTYFISSLQSLQPVLGESALVRETSALMQEYPGEVTLAAGRDALALLPESDLARRAYALLILGCAQYISLGDMQTAGRSFEQAIRLSQSAGDAFTELMIRSHVIGMRAIQGRLRAAEMSTDELLSLAGQPGWEHLPAAGLARVWGSPVLYERNDLAGALEVLTQGIAEVESYSFI